MMLLVLCKKDRPVWVLCSMLSKPKPVCFRGFVCRGRAEQKVLLLSLMRRRWLTEAVVRKADHKEFQYSFLDASLRRYKYEFIPA